MFVTAYYRIDGILLFHYRGATEAAYYSAAYRVLDVLQILPGTVSGVLLPLLASAEREGARQRAGQAAVPARDGAAACPWRCRWRRAGSCSRRESCA